MESIVAAFAHECERSRFPDISQILKTVRPEHQATLFSQLLLIEATVKQKNRIAIDWQKVFTQFPEYPAEIKAVIREMELNQTLDLDSTKSLEVATDPASYSPSMPSEENSRQPTIDFQSGIERETLNNELPSTDRPEVDTAGAQQSDLDDSEPDFSLATPFPDRKKTALDYTLGPYHLIRMLGEGGMGAVWLARQQQPVKREVAIKVIRESLTSGEVMTRFAAERQALAMMDHPNIARILDAGTTSDGRPYFAMELVQGENLTDYCKSNPLSIKQRLSLFLEICAGVQHAHQKGIVHRDLKPGNIIVTKIDGRAVPKVIDFGLAKVVDHAQQMSLHTSLTGVGQVLGTLKYMSPEQAFLDNADIDTRADIYSLGVILYELLTGSTPLDSSTLRGQAVLKILEWIREHEPVRPSQQLMVSRQSSDSNFSKTSKNEHSRLTKVLAGDLDWVVMKAIEKQRARRYPTVSGLAEDIQRFLNDEPVVARPPSLNYRISKFVRKNRIGVISGTALLLTLIAGVIGTTLGMFRAIEAERTAVVSESKAILASEESRRARLAEATARKLAEQKQRDAEESLQLATRGNEILGSVFSNLDPFNQKSEGQPIQARLKSNLVDATNALKATSIPDIRVYCKLQANLGEALTGLGEYQSAVQLFRELLDKIKNEIGPDDELSVYCMNNLAIALTATGDFEEAIATYQQLNDIMRRVAGEHAPATLLTMNNLAVAYQNMGRFDEAIKMGESIWFSGMQSLPPEDENLLLYMHNLANHYRLAGRLDEAVTLGKDTLAGRTSKLGRNHPETITTLGGLGQSYLQLEQLDKALPLLEEAYQLGRSTLGVDHPDTLISLASLSSAYLKTNQAEKALPLLELCLATRRRTLGDHNPLTLSNMRILADAYVEVRQFDKALLLYEEAEPLSLKIFGKENTNTIQLLQSISDAFAEKGEMDAAISKLLEAKLYRTNLSGKKHPDTLYVNFGVALLYVKNAEFEKAEQLLEENYEIAIEALGMKHQTTQMITELLAICYRKLKHSERAIPYYQKLITTRKQELGDSHPQTLESMRMLCTICCDIKDEKQVELAANDLLAVQKEMYKDNPAAFIELLMKFGNNFSTQEMPNLAIGKLDEAIGLTSATTPALLRFQCLTLRAEIRLKEAEVQDDSNVRQSMLKLTENDLLAAFELAESLESDKDKSVQSTVQRLVRLYSIWVQVDPDQEEQWKRWKTLQSK